MRSGWCAPPSPITRRISGARTDHGGRRGRGGQILPFEVAQDTELRRGVKATGFFLLSSVSSVVEYAQSAASADASWRRNSPTSVTIPTVCDDPRSASFVTTAGLM